MLSTPSARNDTDCMRNPTIAYFQHVLSHSEGQATGCCMTKKRTEDIRKDATVTATWQERGHNGTMYIPVIEIITIVSERRAKYTHTHNEIINLLAP